jgi:hypothetical protein
MRTLYLNLPWRDAIYELRKFIPAEDLIDAIHAGLLAKRKVPSIDGPALAWSDVENAFRDRASQLYVEQRYPLKIAVEPRSLDDLLTLRATPIVAAAEERLLGLIFADGRPVLHQARQEPRERERAQRETIIQNLLNTGCRPGRNRDEKWLVFCQKVREIAGKKEKDRGWGDPIITRVS